MSISLPDNHRRSLSVTCRLVEKALFEIEELLTGIPRESLTNPIQMTYEPAERKRLLDYVQTLRQQNRELFFRFNLEADSISDKQIVKAKLNHLWVILEDSTAEHMKGFGRLPDEMAGDVNRRINALAKTVAEMIHLSVAD